MKKCVCKLVVAFLVPLVLFSTTSFTIEKHKCGDNICSVSFKGFESNGYKSNKTFSHSANSCCLVIENTCSINGENCCEDNSILVNGTVIKKEKITQIKIEKIVSFNFLYVPINIVPCNKQKLARQYATYSSPLITKDINVINEVFLI
ncbi:MAG: hypothetical protein L3J34_01790 [Flavobacteriaceae bacterium]|nr:hypothetical protein [Flavobacteriaceae bacterium]